MMAGFFDKSTQIFRVEGKGLNPPLIDEETLHEIHQLGFGEHGQNRRIPFETSRFVWLGLHRVLFYPSIIILNGKSK